MIWLISILGQGFLVEELVKLLLIILLVKVGS